MKSIFLIIFLLNFSFLFSQDTAYQVPQELILNRQLSKSQYIKNNCLYDSNAPGNRNRRAVKDKEDRNIILNFDVIFPIGWSKDGKFAYVEPAVEAGGYEIQILDLVHDSTLSRLYLILNDEDWEKAQKWTLSNFWNNQYKEIDSLLSYFRIIQQKEFVLKEFPIWVMNKEGEGGDQDEWLYLNTTFDFNSRIGFNKTFENKMTYYLQSSTKGLKKINESYYNPETEWGFSNLGYLKSPYENRIALLNTKTHRWFCEGPPATEILYILGVHLKTGFKK